MSKKNQRLLLLVLCVALLVVVSSRISPKTASERQQDEDELFAGEMPAASTESEAPVTETPKEPEVPKRGRDLFPNVSLNDWNLRLVNGTCVLPNSFAPEVTKIQDEQYIDSRIVEPLNAMLDAVREAGYSVCVRNGYRPYATQAYIFNGKASQIQWGTDMTLLEAETEARKVVAYPGTSEHQTGLCVDVLDTSTTSMDAASARYLPMLQWLAEHCSEYGFILRYPENKQEITGWNEPWHFRYVGEDVAAYIMENDLCLEEFVDGF